jgi:Tol biopolymer transport system component
MGDRLAKLVTMSVESGRVEAFPAPAPGHSPSWSAATNRVVYLELSEATATQPSQTTLAITDGGTRRLYPNASLLQGFANGQTAWAPDGRRVALVAYQANSHATIWIFDPDAREGFTK